ncbi:MAG TPA: hypothetical protein VGG08_03765 [Solirubrobacteraceae bacterium]
MLELPGVPGPERLRELIEQEAPVALRGRHRRERHVTRVMAGLALCLVVAVAGALLSSAGDGPGLNVAAAAYAASAPRAGVVEAVWFSRVLHGSERGSTLRTREWVEASGGRREQRDLIAAPGEATQRSDWVFAPGRQEYWGPGGSTRGHPQARIRVLLGREGLALKVHAAFGGLALYGSEGMRLYRALYERGELHLVGHTLYRGRRLWRLESHYPGPASQRTHTRDVVLVDPHSFLPVVVRLLDDALPGRPAISETTLVSYRSLTRVEVPGGTFHLAVQHPHSAVLVVGYPQRLRN